MAFYKITIYKFDLSKNMDAMMVRIFEQFDKDPGLQK